MKNMQAFILLLALSIQLSLCLFNPGILITVPFPIQLPHADLKLPFQIDPILINDLELSKINVKSVQYTWNFTETDVYVKISDAVVLFNWKFKSNSGQGTFQQSQYEIDLQYKFIQTAQNRVKINVVSSKSKLGHSSVHLGGTNKQLVIVEVTDLILNHAAILFRKAIEKAISGAVESFSSILEKDPQIFCSNSTSSCAYLNSTLVSPPIISNKTLVIQLNGASYVSGEESGEINPENALVKINSPKIQAQVHVKVVQEIIQKVFKLIPQEYNLDVASKFGTFDLNSVLVSPLFPLMAQYNQPRKFNVLLSKIKATSSNFNQALQTIAAQVQFQINVMTLNLDAQRYETYLPNNCNVSVSTGFKIIYGWKGLSLRIANLKMNSIQCNQDDIRNGYVNPQALLDVKQTMFTLLRTGINGQINGKVVALEFSGIHADLSGKILTTEAIFDLTLSSVPEKSQPSEISLVKLILDQ